MTSKLLFEVENLGLINKASLDIGKINVIVGKNSTGKSTSSKLLFCLLTASSKEGVSIANNEVKSRFSSIIQSLRYSFFNNGELNEDLERIEKLLLKQPSKKLFDDVTCELEHLIENISIGDAKEKFSKDIDKIKEVVLLNEDRTSQYANTFNSLLNSEYRYSLTDNDTYVKFKGITGNTSFDQEILIKGNIRKGIIHREYFDYFNFDNIIYIDSPSILEFDMDIFKSEYNFENNIINSDVPYHLQLLNRKLKSTNKRTVYDEKYYENLINFKKIIDSLIGGNFKFDKKSQKFIFEKNDEVFPMGNTASGLKQLGILQLLLENRELTENSFLIMDEPEINLHPELQVKLAEILVLAAKELNITVYINTHSPFLAEAIEVYSKNLDIFEYCNFYLTEKISNEQKFDFILMKDMDIMEIYENLGAPFETINKIRFQNELKNK